MAKWAYDLQLVTGYIQTAARRFPNPASMRNGSDVLNLNKPVSITHPRGIFLSCHLWSSSGK